MKRIIFFLTLIVTVSIFVACSSDDGGDGGNGGNNNYTGQPADVSQWKMPTDRELYPKAMFVLLDSSGAPVKMMEGDLLAAFIDDVCMGVCKAERGTDDYLCCALKVNLFMQDASRGDLKVELRYYSQNNKLAYTAHKITFQEEQILGRYKAGYCPQWK